mgnify:FL=1
MKEENRKRKEEERRNKPKLGLTEEQILTTICDYKRILDRVKDVADEIGFLTDEFDTLEPDKTEFYGDMVRITAYDSHYDMYDSTSGSFPIRFLSEDESEHKDWYAKKRESLEQARETERLAQEERKERAELERLRKKYEEKNACTD